jgi:hypothetical protein
MDKKQHRHCFLSAHFVDLSWSKDSDDDLMPPTPPMWASITNESSEAAPGLRHHGVFRTPTHTRASSLPKMSAGITNPCACINQPARALAQGTDRPAYAGQRNNY